MTNVKPVFHVSVPCSLMPIKKQEEFIEKVKNLLASAVSPDDAHFIITSDKVTITKLVG